MPIASVLLNVEVTEELRFNKHITKEICVKIRDQDVHNILINKVAVIHDDRGTQEPMITNNIPILIQNLTSES